MISRRAQQNIVAAVLLLMFAAALFVSFDYGPRARLVPVPIAILCIALLVGQIVLQNLRSADDLNIDTLELFTGRSLPQAEDEAKMSAPPADVADEPAGPRRWADSELLAFALVGLLLVPFIFLGPVVAVFLFATGYFVLSGHCTWVRALAYALLCTGVLYFMFGVVLDVDLNRGVAMPFLNQFVRF